VAFAVGIVLMIAAPESRQGVGFIRLLGLFAMAKAVVIAVLSKERYQRLSSWWFDPVREQSWRVWGLVLLILGVVVLSWL
jgi:cobalamin synthase